MTTTDDIDLRRYPPTADDLAARFRHLLAATSVPQSSERKSNTARRTADRSAFVMLGDILASFGATEEQLVGLARQAWRISQQADAVSSTKNRAGDDSQLGSSPGQFGSNCVLLNGFRQGRTLIIHPGSRCASRAFFVVRSTSFAVWMHGLVTSSGLVKNQKIGRQYDSATVSWSDSASASDRGNGRDRQRQKNLSRTVTRTISAITTSRSRP